jgi:hypothetical protein
MDERWSGWIGSWRDLRRELAASAAFGLFLGALGPFGTYVNGGLAERMLYWVGALVVGVLVYGLGVRFALHLGARYRQPVWFVLPLAVAVIGIPYSAVSAVVVVGLWPSVAHFMHPADWYGQSFIIGLPLNALAVWIRSLDLPRSATAAAPAIAAPAQPALDRPLKRLAPALLCLQVEDHYVRAHTASGSNLMLIALKDAIAELEDVEGLQVHRSWWVAKAAVAGPVTHGRNLALRLSNGLEVPVSRGAAPKLRDAGWLLERDGVVPTSESSSLT